MKTSKIIFSVLTLALIAIQCKKEEGNPEGISQVDFSIPGGSIYNGCEVLFSNSTIGALSQEWNFGDGATSAEKSPAHIYKEPGTYIVKLKAVNGLDSKEATKSITVLSPQTFRKHYPSVGLDVYSVGTFTTQNGVSTISVEKNGNTSFKIFLEQIASDGSRNSKEVISVNRQYRELVTERCTDNGYFIGISFLNENNLIASTLIKTNQYGAIDWQKAVPTGIGITVSTIVQLKDGGCILATYINDIINYPVLYKYNSVGTLVLEKTIVQQDIGYKDGIYSGIEIENGDFLFVGETNQDLNANFSDGWFFRTTSNLDLIQNSVKKIGIGNTIFKKIIASHNQGSYVIAGRITGAKKEDAILWQLDKNGNGDLLNIFQSDEPDWFESVIKTHDGYIAVGGTWSGGGYAKGLVARFDSKGISSPVEFLYKENYNTFLDDVAIGSDCSLFFNGLTDRGHDMDADLYIVKTDSRGKGN